MDSLRQSFSRSTKNAINRGGVLASVWYGDDGCTVCVQGRQAGQGQLFGLALGGHEQKVRPTKGSGPSSGEPGWWKEQDPVGLCDGSVHTPYGYDETGQKISGKKRQWEANEDLSR